MTTPMAAPSLWQTLSEIRTPLHLPELVWHLRALARAPKGDGRAILLLPGYLTDKYAMRPLQKYLTYLGYQVFDWGQGRNLGQVEKYVALEIDNMQSLADANNISQFTLIGWSLGGVIAREMARLNPELVTEVVTLGSPITGGPVYTAPGQRFIKKQQIDIDQLQQKIRERNQMGLPQKVTSIYSKRDGIVAWQASVDSYNDHARNIEVGCTHLAMGISAEVWLHIAHLLND